jgi:hypothetical protein
VPRRATGRGEIGQGRAVQLRLLRHQGDAGSRREDPLPVVGLGETRQNAQQGRLAGAVAPDQAGAPPGFEPHVDPVEQPPWAVGEAHGAQGQNRRRHDVMFPFCAPAGADPAMVWKAVRV